MIKVKEIAVSRLLKFEVFILLNDVVKVLQEHNPETLRLQDVYEILMTQKAKIEFFNQPYGPHLLTSKLDKLRIKRLKCASLIHSQVSSLEKSFLPETQLMAKTAMKLAKTYLTYLGQMSQFEINVQIRSFIMNLETSPLEQEAFQALGLQPYIDELERINNQCYKTKLNRSRDIKERPPTGDRALERETQRVLRMFYDHVNYTQQAFKDIDYTLFISRLNLDLTVCSKNIKTRIATNKRRARKKAAATKAAADAATNKASKESLIGDKCDTAPTKNPQNDEVDSNKAIKDEGKKKKKPKDGSDKKGEKGK